MISLHLLNFAIVILSQLAFFLFHAWKVGELSNVKKYLIQGCLLGLPFGVASDLILGHQISLWSYEIGFVWWFLIINGIFSYGFMIANIILLYHHTFSHMLFWVGGVAIVYEIVNYFFPVWQWEFATFGLVQLSILYILYALLTWGMMLVLRIIYQIRFRLIPF